MAEDLGRKRASARQLTDRDDVDDNVAEVDSGVFQQADASTMATRKLVTIKGRRAGATPAAEPTPAINWSFNPTPAAATTAATTAEPTPASPAKEASEKAATPAASPAKESAASTPAKETTPTKEATPTKEGTPVKAVTPAKEGTPVKEGTTTPVKEGATPASGTPTETKPFSLFGNFPAPSTTQPFSTFPSFPSFSFTQPNTFASSSGASIFGQNIAPPKPKEAGDEEGDGEDGESATIPEPEPTGAPTVLPVVPVVTGEEEETTLHSVRAKLYAMEGQAWKERGVGQLKLNRNKEGKVRLIMRDQGGKHLRLNVAVFAEMKFERPADNAIRFIAFVDKAHTIFLLKVARKDEANELLNAIETNKPKASSSTTTTPESTPEKKNST